MAGTSLQAATEKAVSHLLADLSTGRPAGAVVAVPSPRQVVLRFPTVPALDAEYLVVRPVTGGSPETIAAVRITGFDGDRVHGTVLWSTGDLRSGDGVVWPARIAIVLLPTEADDAAGLSAQAGRLDTWLELRLLTEHRLRVLRAGGAQDEHSRVQRLQADREYGLIVAPLLVAGPDGIEIVLRVRSIYTGQTLAQRQAVWAQTDPPARPPRVASPEPPPERQAPYGSAIRPVPTSPTIQRAVPSPDHQHLSVPATINALALGDVDGDGRPELIGVSDRQVMVYAWHGSELVVRAASDPLPPFTTYLHVDAADVDGDGRDEIVVTAIRSVPRHTQIDNTLLGAIFRVRAARLEALVEGVDRHLRVLRGPGEPPLLLAQRLGDWSPTDGPVELFRWSAGRYQLGPRAPLAGAVTSVYGFATADLDGDGRREVAAVAADGRLRLYDEAGRLLGTSDEDLGEVSAVGFAQTPRHPDYRGLNFDAGAQLLAQWRPIPRRVVVAAAPDGGLELVTLANPRTVGLRLAAAPPQSGPGRTVGYGWDAGARRLARRWESKELRARALDLAAGDLAGDGRPRLLVLSGDGERRFVDIFALYTGPAAGGAAGR